MVYIDMLTYLVGLYYYMHSAFLAATIIGMQL